MKKLVAFFLSVQLTILPCQRAYAVVPIVAGVAYAIDYVAPQIISYIGSEVIFQTITKGMDAGDAYYSAKSKISNSRFAAFIKKRAKIGNVVAAAILAGLGYYFSDGSVVQHVPADIAQNDVVPTQGYYWKVVITTGVNITDAATKKYASYLSKGSTLAILPYKADPSLENLRTVQVISYAGNVQYEERAIRYECDDSSSSIATCGSSYTYPNTTTEAVADAVVLGNIEQQIPNLNLSNADVGTLTTDNGVLDSDLISDLSSESVPVMPDGETLIPKQGDQLWTYAHQISTGSAQTTDSGSSTYVPSSSWDTAYYLSNTVANSNPYITELNSTGIGTDTGTGTDTGSGTTVETGAGTVVIDLSGVESRLDKSNSITQQILDGLGASNQSVETTIVPDSSKAASFWNVRSPEGLKGVFSTFKDSVLSTPIFQWLDSFSLNVGAANEPAFELCFGTIAQIDFGCYSLSADSYVWSAIKAMMIFCALIVSRRIIFGG